MSEFVMMPKADYEAACNSIRAKTGKTELIKSGAMSTEIDSITGGGASDDVRYVTFMSYDGTTEYGKKAVAVGDDCADPIARGVFDTPTRESTAQYDYSFYGWATTPNGAADANWNKAVTEDRTVYANFAAVLRYYTITYLDDDGSVLKTESLAYGSMPSYAPEKDGFAFTGWSPTLATVTGNASYQATWTSVITFANATWSQIAEIAEEGTAEDCFEVGDTKDIVFTVGGTSITMPVIIAGFNHDDLADGSGKAAISIVCGKSLTHIATKAGSDGNFFDWSSIYMRRYLNSTLKQSLPEALQSVIKNVNKVYNSGRDSSGQVLNKLSTTIDAIWVPSSTEVGFDSELASAYSAHGQGAQYPLFTDNTSRTRKSAHYTSGTGKSVWLTRSMYTGYAATMVAVSSAGAAQSGSPSTSASTTAAIVFGFCI